LIISLSIPKYKRQLTYKCIVNNNAEIIKAPITLISLKYTQNWLKYITTDSHQHSIAHGNICRRLFRGKMHSDWFHGVEVVQGRWQHGEDVGYCYPNRLERAICKWDIPYLLA